MTVPLPSAHQRSGWATGVAIFILGFTTFAMLNCVQPLMPIFAAQFSISAAESSLSLSLTTIVLAVGMLFASNLADVFGLKTVIIVATTSASLLCMACGLATNWPTLLILRSVLGLALSGLPGITMAYVSTELGGRDDGNAMGLYIAGTTIGGLGGRFIVASLADHFSWQVAFVVLGAISLAGSAAVLWALPTPRHALLPQQRSKSIAPFLSHLKNASLFPLFCVAALLMGGFVSTYNALAFHLQGPAYGWSQAQIGLVYTAYLAGTVGSLAAGLLSRRVGQGRALCLFILVMGIGTLILVMPSVPLLISGLVVFTFGFFAVHATASAWVGRLALTNKAQAASIYLLFYYVGSALISIAGGLAWSAAGWQAVMLLVGATVVCSLGFAIFALRRSGLP